MEEAITADNFISTRDQRHDEEKVDVDSNNDSTAT